MTNIGTVTAVSGPVTLTRPPATPHPLRSGDVVYGGDIVEVPKDGFARLLLGDRTTVTVRELSRLELQRERRADGMLYALELVWGRLRVSVARMMLMRRGEHLDVRTRNAVASVRGTDFIVEALEPPGQAQVFGLLGASAVGRGVQVDGSGPMETVVTTLSGIVEVSNRRSGTGRVERIRASETSAVRGRQDPVRLHMIVDDLK
jgi:hypothetical protein